MLTLAIDTSARDFSLALFHHSKLIQSVDSLAWEARQRPDSGGAPLSSIPTVNASVSLFPALAALMAEAEKSFRALDLIAVAYGPGMFTGLRMGVVAAKTLAYVNQTPLVAVNTLEVIASRASQAMASAKLIRPVLNAQRQQLFAGVYQPEERGGVREIEPNRIVDRQDWIAGIGPEELLTGTGLKPMVKQLEDSDELRRKRVQIADPALWACDAEGVGHVGMQKFLAGEVDDFWTVEPFYFRPSAAEEVLTSKTRPAGRQKPN